MPDKDKEGPKRKYAERFKAESADEYLAEVEKAYGELEGKIGTQGSEVGDLRKKFDTVTQQLSTTAQAAQKMQEHIAQNKSLVDWYQSPGGQQWLKDAKHSMDTTQSASQTQVPLSTAELEAMYPGIGNWVEKNVLAPREQQYGQYIQSELQKQRTEITQEFEDKTRRTNNAMFELMKSALPEESVKTMEKFSSRVMELADPSKQDPADMARKSLSQEAQLMKVETELATMKKDKDTAAQYEGMPVGQTASTDDLSSMIEPQTQLSDRDVMEKVFADVDKEHGHGTIRNMGNILSQ